jgi:hypothetical protein
MTSISIYDMLGNEILPVVNKFLNRGEYIFDINVSDIPPGIYQYILKTPSDILHNTMIITR